MQPEARLPPQNLVAEQSVLGSLFLRNSAVDEVASILSASDFYSDKNQRIYSAFIGMWESGQRGIDAVTIAEQLNRLGQLDEIGGVPYLMEINEAVPNAGSAKYYANIVRNKARQRAAINVLTDSLESLYSPQPDDEIDRTLAKVETGLHRVIESAQRNEPQPTSVLAVDLLAQMTTDRSSQRFIKTGYAGIDQTTGGIGPGKVVVLAARTSHGKTAFVCSLALRLARAGNPCLIASYEQNWDEILYRLIAIESRVQLKSVEVGGTAPDERYAIAEGCNAVGLMPLFIDDSQPDELALVTMLRLAARKHGIKVAVIDYLQLVEPRDRRVIREQQVTGVSRSLKKIALEAGICVLVLSQLNRGVEHRDDKRPRLADLRESGAIEQDADQVWLLHRPSKDVPGEYDDHGELIIAKNRSGPCGLVKLKWNAHLTEFTE
ncbi:AAA family ATPase [bacterium]|nr:AAA family ATPase [bacterium]